MALPGGHLVSGTTHRLSGLGQSCGEKLCALYMGLNGDSSRLDGRLESPTRTCMHSAHYSPRTAKLYMHAPVASAAEVQVTPVEV